MNLSFTKLGLNVTTATATQKTIEYPGIDTSKCTGCNACELHCSYAKVGNKDAFNAKKAFIEITTNLDKPNEIVFTDECDGCGICAFFCPYGALIHRKGKKVG